MRPVHQNLIFVVCLCAEWCSSCRAYRAVFDAVARTAAASARFAWIDVEDQPDVMGDLDIETFPTLLVADGDGALFFGAVTPHASTLSALVERGMRGDLPRLADAAAAEIAARAIAHAAG